MSSRRTFFQLTAAAGAGGLIRWQLDPTTGLLFEASRVLAAVQAAQTPLPGYRIRQFAEPLTTFAGRRVTGSPIRVGMFEFQQRLLPDAMYEALPAPFNRGSYVWGYAVGNDDDPFAESADDFKASYPGVTIEARKGTPTTVRYSNNLPRDPVLRTYLTIDQTIHWADPLHQHGSLSPYTGPIPTVVHLHGAEDQSTSDGAPEAWFTNTGLHGPGYFSASPTEPNAAVYAYPNNQQSTTLWFHDHALGITRINVYSGLVAFYFVRDQFDTGRTTNPLRLPAGAQEIELMIQDRQFDTNGQLLFPDSSIPSLIDGAPSNPGIHPNWIPEFFGDAMLVNGRTWPFLNVEPRRYRFRIVNACNARFVRMGLVDAASGALGPPIWQIGTDGGLLDVPVKLEGRAEPFNPGDPHATTRLFLAPSERADIIIDFSRLAGRRLTLTNDSQVPFPSGAALGSADDLIPNDPMVNVMQFRVSQPPSSQDTTYDPASLRPLRGGSNQEPVIVRLVNPRTGTLARGVVPNVTRQLILFEFEDLNGSGQNSVGTPIEDLVNNTRWAGRRDGGGNDAIPGSRVDQSGQDIWMTELPRVGSTEVWEFLNLTVDAHPIHIHLIQFQLLNRQAVAIDPATGAPTYLANWMAQFPGGTFNGEGADGTWSPVTYPAGTVIPGYGPPNPYFTPNGDGALGGNPAFSGFLGNDPPIPPNPNEAGWKDVAKVFPGYVNRYAIRWAPQATAIDGVRPGQNLYSFDPTRGPGYLVHCHILDHEDNEMMRPYMPVR